jgi:mannose-6-phosphate isomerase-like protein (cupin superfamily)
MKGMSNMYQCPYFGNMPIYNPDFWKQLPNQYVPYTNQAITGDPIILKDYGPEPFVINIDEATKQNNTFRTALWTGSHLQLTLMSLNIGEDIGLEIHPGVDQFIRIEEGQGLVKMGDSKYNLYFQRNVNANYAIFIPADTWHNIINAGNIPLKLYSIYAPPQHPHGTVHTTKAIAQAAE